jgi:TonB family protein
MKKWLLTLASLLLAHFICGQGVILEETLVESPRFSLEKTMVHQTGQRAPIYQYIQSNLEYPHDALWQNEEGIVVVRFMVETDGSLRNISIDNSVSPSLDQCVMDLLALTSGKWLPGKVNGKPTAMESKVYVNFDIKGNLSHREKARQYLIMAIRQCDLGVALSQNDLVKKRKSQNRFKKAMQQLDMAQKHQPEELAIVSWQVIVLGHMGDATKLAQKQAELNSLLANVQAE